MKIGILGGGQLARMILESGYRYGFEFHIFSKEKNSPAGQLTGFEITGDWNDENFLLKFSSDFDIITLENEFIDYHRLKFLEDNGKSVYPSSQIIKLIQDKLYQKENLKSSGIPVAEFKRADTVSDVLDFISGNSYPVVLKSRTMGYDGKGNFTVNDERQVYEAFEILSGRGKLMCEKFINFEKEIATQVVRNKSGEIKVYPVVETIQKDHICNMVIASDNFSEEIKEKVNSVAEKIVTELDYTGVMGIEMFLTDNEITVNELAPRVHNSGHYTIEGCRTSQFENHIRAILDYPLGSTEKIYENVVMINILGTGNAESMPLNLDKVLKNDNVYVHIYGKKKNAKGRKMGHITVINRDLERALELANLSREMLGI